MNNTIWTEKFVQVLFLTFKTKTTLHKNQVNITQTYFTVSYC